MIDKSIQDLISLINHIGIESNFSDKSNYRSRLKITSRPSVEEIENAEKKLKCKLPPSYIAYHLEAEWYSYFCGINLISSPFTEKEFDHILIESIVEINEDVRSKNFYKDLYLLDHMIPDHLVIFDSSNCGDEDYYCFDTRNPNHEGEYPVIHWSPALSDIEIKNIEKREIAFPNFSTYLYNIIAENYINHS